VRIPTTQGIDQWLIRRRNLRRWFWIYLAIAAIGALLFIRNFQSGDPYLFAIFLLISLLSLRQAWRMDRQIVECDKHMPMIIEYKEKT
jgi:hypothetical protein